MVSVTRMNGESFLLNATLIEMIEATPDTVITLSSGKKFVVREGAKEVAQKVTAYYREIGLAGVHSQQWRLTERDEV